MSSSSEAVACHLCGDTSRWFKHYVRHLGTIKSLCTDCVIHLHARSLCPICFTVHEDPDRMIASNVVVSCVRCYSSSHVSCIGSHPNVPYLCVMCANLNSPLLVLGDLDARKVIDKKSAKVLLAACKISADSMKAAAADAKVEAEVKIKDAIESGKLAKQAVEHAEHLRRNS